MPQSCRRGFRQAARAHGVCQAWGCAADADCGRLPLGSVCRDREVRRTQHSAINGHSECQSRVNRTRQTKTNAGPFGPAFGAHVNSEGILAASVRFAQPILNCVVRWAVVPSLKGRIRGRVSCPLPAAGTKPQLRSAIDRWPVVTSILWRSVIAPVLWPVAGCVHRHAPSAVVVPATAAAILSFGNRRDNGQCSDPDKQSSHAGHVFFLVCASLWFAS